ncbi:hypothetical protein KSP39_PZI001753 [Platanthera zijinensis]|uniref:Uncharacterized protein n=1 Tax=Platanthera zijinensis TaxID=2320716 RepID=A0AAP0BXI5_9ASPA
MRVLATKCILIILGKVNEKLNVLALDDSSAESVTIVIKKSEGVEAMQKRMDKVEIEVELLKKWNATLVVGTQEDPPLNPYGKRLQKEVHALDTACARLSMDLTGAHSAFVEVMNDLKSSDGGDITCGAGDG